MQDSSVQDRDNSTDDSLQGNDIVMIAIGKQQKVESSSYSKWMPLLVSYLSTMQ